VSARRFPASARRTRSHAAGCRRRAALGGLDILVATPHVPAAHDSLLEISARTFDRHEHQHLPTTRRSVSSRRRCRTCQPGAAQSTRRPGHRPNPSVARISTTNAYQGGDVALSFARSPSSWPPGASLQRRRAGTDLDTIAGSGCASRRSSSSSASIRLRPTRTAAELASIYVLCGGVMPVTPPARCLVSPAADFPRART